MVSSSPIDQPPPGDPMSAARRILCLLFGATLVIAALLRILTSATHQSIPNIIVMLVVGPILFAGLVLIWTAFQPRTRL